MRLEYSTKPEDLNLNLEQSIRTMEVLLNTSAYNFGLLIGFMKSGNIKNLVDCPQKYLDAAKLTSNIVIAGRIKQNLTALKREVDDATSIVSHLQSLWSESRKAIRDTYGESENGEAG